jgi:hypothetical protein
VDGSGETGGDGPPQNPVPSIVESVPDGVEVPSQSPPVPVVGQDNDSGDSGSGDDAIGSIAGGAREGAEGVGKAVEDVVGGQ